EVWIRESGVRNRRGDEASRPVDPRPRRAVVARRPQVHLVAVVGPELERRAADQTGLVQVRRSLVRGVDQRVVGLVGEAERLDDVGFSAMECYGGPIPTPNIDRVVGAGVRYTQFHTTALCSPTRSCLLTGRNHTRNGMACITECASGFPNANGVIPPENGQIQQILGERGWNTYMVGKWHLCPEDEMNLASTRRNWPTGRGFERFYGFLGAETNQWYPELVYDSHPVDPPRSPEEGYHLTVDLTDKALEFIKDA